jgi:hypothetical protein
MSLKVRILLLPVLLAISCSAFFPSAVKADTQCAAGNLASLVGTTCDIGSLQFSFTSFAGSNEAVNGSLTIYNDEWSASDFTLTPAGNGFTISLNSGPESITAYTSVHGIPETVDAAVLSFDVTDLSGDLTGMEVDPGTLSATGSYLASASATGTVLCDGCSSSVSAQVDQDENMPLLSEQDQLTGSPFASGSGSAEPFLLDAENGDSASWGGTSTFTFDTAAVASPEPSTLPMLALALVVLCGVAICRRRQLPVNPIA